jgi:hypothetical protein
MPSPQPSSVRAGIPALINEETVPPPNRGRPGGGSLTLNWLITEPFPGSGGHLGIFRMVKHLVEFGHECHLYIIPVNNMHSFNAAQLREWIDRTFFPTGAYYHRWTGQVLPADATFATYWKTVPTALKLPEAGRLYYLVQDFEPFFYAVGSEYLQCENTYRAGVHCIALGAWLGRLMRERYHATADHFDFAVETEIYRPQPELQQVTPARHRALPSMPGPTRRVAATNWALPRCVWSKPASRMWRLSSTVPTNWSRHPALLTPTWASVTPMNWPRSMPLAPWGWLSRSPTLRLYR